MKKIIFFIFVCVYSSFSFAEEIRAARGMSLEERINYLHKGYTVINNIHALDQSNINYGTVSQHSWSDDYWPYLVGGISYRYKDKRAPSIESSKDPNLWRKVLNYYKQNPAVNLVNQGRLDQLSPAEKYDLLFGNLHFPLAQKERMRLNEKTLPWYGICEGWSGAAMYEKAPRKRIFVRDITGKYNIPFNPSDLRALISKVYAVGSRFFSVNNVKRSLVRIGSSTCRKNYTGVESGKIVEKECFDPNPATFHKTLLNFIGRLKRSFYMDITFDRAIWNQPVQSYTFKYFNPINANSGRGFAKKFTDAMILKNNFHGDRFKRYRSPRAKYIVGVEMFVTYNVEMLTYNLPHVSPGEELKETERYIYDLEIDASGKIIGGEWHSKNRPDTLIAGPKDFKSVTIYDNQVRGNNIQELLKSAQPYAGKASGRGTPLGKVVRELVKMSSRP